jgi:integrase
MPRYESPEGWVATLKDNHVVIKDGLASYKVKQAKNGYFRKYIDGRSYSLGKDYKTVHPRLRQLEAEAKFEPACKETGKDLTVGQMTEGFYDWYRQQIAKGERRAISLKTHMTAHRFLRQAFDDDDRVNDLTPGDFRRLEKVCLAGNIRQNTARNRLNSCIAVFNWATDMYPGEVVVKRGLYLKRIDKKKQRAEKKEKNLPWTADEAQKVLSLSLRPEHSWRAVYGGQLHLAILIGLNTGSTPKEILEYTWADVEPDGWMTPPRSKNGNFRRFRLWPEVMALLGKRPATPSKPLLKWTVTGGIGSMVTRNFILLKKAENLPTGWTFYSTRTTLINNCYNAGFTSDVAAIECITGHSNNHASHFYRERPDDERIWAVLQSQREWLFGSDQTCHVKSR